MTGSFEAKIKKYIKIVKIKVFLLKYLSFMGNKLLRFNVKK